MGGAPTLMESIARLEPGWSTSFCDCLSCDHAGDASICCCGMLCPCILQGYNRDALEGGGCFRGCCMCMQTCCVIGSETRRKIRFRYGITDGGSCDDWMLHCPCLASCALCQEAREVSSCASASLLCLCIRLTVMFVQLPFL